MLVNPASSATAERSFSMLRRLKHWLRATMTQRRLNSCAVLSAHQIILDDIDWTSIAQDFISRNEFRRRLFGSFATKQESTI